MGKKGKMAGKKFVSFYEKDEKLAAVRFLYCLNTY